MTETADAAEPLSDLSRLCIHTITTKPWPIEEAIEKYAAAGVAGITVWRDALKDRDAADIGETIRNAGLKTVSLCRGGFFPARTERERRFAIDDNRLAIEQAASIGAPLVVLVCGAAPGQSLEVSRGQILDGIAAVLPDAEAAGVKLAIEPLHPMYAAERSAINTMAQANAACEALNHPLVGIAVDVYHVWWDDQLETQVRRAADRDRLFAFHVCDWLSPTTDLLNDRGLMGEGVIDLPRLRRLVESAGFRGFHEVEIFSERWWAMDQDHFLKQIAAAYLRHC